MGAWDFQPWDNDSAADWYGDLFDRTKLAQHVEATLQLDPETNGEKVRAAASLVLMLGRTYIWPIHDLDRHLTLAADQLERLAQASEEAEDPPELIAQIRAEIAELRSRIRPPGAEPPAPSSAPPEKPWWQFWK